MSSVSEKSEKELLKRLKQGDEDAFNLLYHKYRNSLYNSIYKMIRLEDESADLLQDLFIKIWQKRGDVDPELPFKGFIYRMAQNIVYDFFRAAARDKKIEEKLVNTAALEPDYTPIDDRIQFKHSEAQVKEILDQLPQQCRQVFIYCKIEGRGYEETAKLLGISKATVNNHITNANKLLKNIVNHSNYLPLALIAIEFWAHN